MAKNNGILLIPIILICVFVAGCTAQKPVSQAPVWNITLTDNSQWVMGDNNKTQTKASTTTDQVAKPVADSTAKNSGNPLFVFFLGIIIGILLCVGGYLAYLKWWKK